MTREETLEAIKVMQHYADGGEVEQRLRYDELDWHVNHYPNFDFLHYDYRIKKATKKKIKLEAWMENADGNLVWQYENSEVQPYLSRVPSEDKWVEVEE